MTLDDDILQKVCQAFADCRRPAHFTDYTHCEECVEHDKMLRSRDIHTIRIADVGNPGWNPICFISPEGFIYYLPALARLALDEPDHVHGWYGGQFLWHLCYDGHQKKVWSACTPQQRRVVVLLLRHIGETRAGLVEREMHGEDLLQAIQVWSD